MQICKILSANGQKKSTGQCVRWFEKSTGQFKKPPAFVRFPILNTTPAEETLSGFQEFFFQNSTKKFCTKVKGELYSPVTDTHESEHRGHPFRFSGMFSSTYHQGSVQLT